MAVPIVWAIILIIIISFCFYMFFKYINISDRTARRIEIVGYISLTVLIIWEFFVKNIFIDEFYLQESFNTVEKINHLYLLLVEICQRFNIDTSTTNSFFTLENTDYLNLQLLTTSVIEALLQIISTIFIAIGRFQELKNKRS